jgi:transposase-like protein
MQCVLVSARRFVAAFSLLLSEGLARKGDRAVGLIDRKWRRRWWCRRCGARSGRRGARRPSAGAGVGLQEGWARHVRVQGNGRRQHGEHRSGAAPRAAAQHGRETIHRQGRRRVHLVREPSPENEHCSMGTVQSYAFWRPVNRTIGNRMAEMPLLTSKRTTMQICF